MKRLFDIIFALFFLLLFFVPMLIVSLCIKIDSKGTALHWSKRIGVGNKIFDMPKFRTMSLDAPSVATHLLQTPELYVTGVGKFLRKYSLDELPQIWSILKGDMSFVGPRPALFNQEDLVELRTSKGIHKIIPGITGWAQVNGRDEISIPVKVGYDEYYLHNRSFIFDFKILLRTFLKVIKCDGIAH